MQSLIFLFILVQQAELMSDHFTKSETDAEDTRKPWHTPRMKEFQVTNTLADPTLGDDGLAAGLFSSYS
ncbi:MAG TPA: hypothetical protein VHC72_05900 [Bryobacteraceae bacterium]|nr:hypothetical protein [Bryobacteraceae bacterium]